MANENKHTEQVGSVRPECDEERALEKLSKWEYGNESSKLTARDLLLAADALLKEADSIYQPSSLVTGGSPDIYLKLAFARSEPKNNTKEERRKFNSDDDFHKAQVAAKINDQMARELESRKAFDNKNINIKEKQEIDGFNRHVLHGIKFIPFYGIPVFNRVIKAIDDNKLSKFSAPQRGSFVDFLEDPKTFSLYIKALREEYKRKQDYLEVISNQRGVYQKLLSLLGPENNQNGAYQKLLSFFSRGSSVSPETLKQKLDMLQEKSEQITGDSVKRELEELEFLIGTAELLIEKRKAWQLTESDKLYVKSERSKEQNENILKKAEAMSSMSLRDIISKPDIDKNLRLAIVKEKLAGDTDNPGPAELAEALDLAVKYGRKKIYLRLLEEGARHSEKYLKDLNRIKTTQLSPEAGAFSNQPQSPSQSASPSFSDSGNESVNVSDSSRPGTPEPGPSPLQPVSPSFSDSDSSRPETPEPGSSLSQSASLSSSDTDNKPNGNRPRTPVRRQRRYVRFDIIKDVPGSGHFTSKRPKTPKSENSPKALSEVDKGNPPLEETLVDAQSQSESRSASPSFSDSDSESVISRSGTPETSAEDSDDEFVIVRSGMLEQGDSPKALPEVDKGELHLAPESENPPKTLPEVNKGKPSVWSEALTWVATSSRALWELFTTPFRKLRSLITKKNQDFPSAVAADQASDDRALVNAQPKNVPSKDVSVGKNQDGEPPEAVVKPADQTSDKRTLVDAQSQNVPSEKVGVEQSLGEGLPKAVIKAADQVSDKRTLIDAQPQPPETPEPRGESKALPEVGKGESSSWHATWASVIKEFRQKKRVNELPANQASDDRALVNAQPKNVPSNEVSVEEQEINARLALISEEERTRMLEYGAIGKKYLRKLEEVEKTERRQRQLKEKTTAKGVPAGEEREQEDQKKAAKGEAPPRSPMFASPLNLDLLNTVSAMQPDKKEQPAAESKQTPASLSSTYSGMHSSTTQMETRRVRKIDAKASAGDVMQFFLDHAMRIYLGHPESYLEYRDNKDAETFVNGFVPIRGSTRRDEVFQKLFKDLIGKNCFNQTPGFGNYLKDFSKHMDDFAKEIRTRKVVVTISEKGVDLHSHREYKLAAVLAFLIGKRLLEKEYGSDDIPPEKLAQLMQAMAQHFQGNEAYQNSRGQTGSYKAYMDLMKGKADIVLKNAPRPEDVVENVSEKSRSSSTPQKK